MSDVELIRDILANIITAIERIERRFHGIQSPEDFVTDNDGIDRLDGIAMMLIAIGEQVKQKPHGACCLRGSVCAHTSLAAKWS